MGSKRKTDISEDESVPDDIELSSHDEDDEFLIERILAQKTNEDAEDFYLIKWSGYPDDRSSWEPAENITGLETIKEWEDQLAAGDTLDKDEVEALEARMDESTRKRENLRKQKARQRSRMTQQRKGRAQVDTEVRASNALRKSEGRGDHTQQRRNKTCSPERSDKSNLILPATSGMQSSKKPGADDAATPIFHAIETYRNKRRATPPEPSLRTRSQPGARFKSLSHMNDARKKALEERNPMAYTHGKPTMEKSGAAAPRDASHESARSSTRQDSPLFFPDNKSRSPEPGSLVSSRDSSPSIPQRDSAHPPLKPKAADAAPLPFFEPQKTIRTSTGREFEKGELLVQLRFGNYDLGDALLLFLPHWLRARLLKLKDGKLLPIYFDQSLVFNSGDFSEISRVWPPQVTATGAVKSFPDNEIVVSEMAQYFEQHDVAALWEDPDPDSTIGLIMYSPRSKSWRSGSNDPIVRDHPLLLEARNRAFRGSRPVPVRPNRPMSLGLQDEGPSSLCGPQYQSNPRPLAIHPSASQRDSAADMLLSGSLVENSVQTTDPRKRRRSSNEPAIPRGSDNLLKDARAATPLGDTSEVEIPIDWTVTTDFRSLIGVSSTSTGKPWIYIAYAEQHPAQADAARKWAGKHTIGRLVYTDLDGTSDWNDFRENPNTKLVLFHEDNPNFCTLKDFSHLLGRDNVTCYNVSWTTEANVAKYTFSRLFPRGTVLLLPEWTIIKYPKESVFALEWFMQHSKSKYWKVMVRPNVRDWLQQTALDCEDSEKAKELYEILRLLFKLGAGPDVTIARFADHAESLGIGLSRDPELNNFIVPLRRLPGYDDSPEADSSVEAISERDEILLNHFIYWSVMNSSSSRKFIAVDDLQGRMGKGAGKPNGAEHIKFWKPEAFMKENGRMERAKRAGTGP